MKHIAFAVIAAAALAVVGPRISQESAQPKKAAAAPHELFVPSDYRAAAQHGHAVFPSMHFKR